MISNRKRLTPYRLISIICLTLFLLSTFTRAQENDLDASRRYEQQAVADYRSKNYAAFLSNMQKASALRPNHPRLLYNLASAYALTGNGDESLKVLNRLAAMGLFMPVAEDDDFASLKGTNEFNAILKKLDANKLPLNRSTVAFRLSERGLITEGLAYDPVKGDFFIGSVRRREILRVSHDGTQRVFSQPSDELWGVFGMKVDARRRLLWVCSAALPQMSGFTPEMSGRSGLFKYDLRTGRLLGKYLTPDDGRKHVLGDLTLNPRGDVFATDSISPLIYRINHDSDRLETFLSDSSFASLQGLDFTPDGKKLLVADYSRGIFALDVASKKIVQLTPPDDATLLGIDGLYFHHGRLVAVQNGITPQRIVQLTLDRDYRRITALRVLEANHPLSDDLTLGVIAHGDFYFNAAGQWNLFNEEGELTAPAKLLDPVVLRIGLDF